MRSIKCVGWTWVSFHFPCIKSCCSWFLQSAKRLQSRLFQLPVREENYVLFNSCLSYLFFVVVVFSCWDIPRYLLVKGDHVTLDCLWIGLGEGCSFFLDQHQSKNYSNEGGMTSSLSLWKSLWVPRAKNNQLVAREIYGSKTWFTPTGNTSDKHRWGYISLYTAYKSCLIQILLERRAGHIFVYFKSPHI